MIGGQWVDVVYVDNPNFPKRHMQLEIKVYNTVGNTDTRAELDSDAMKAKALSDAMKAKRE